jgi:diguanylate cyclase (GGDEF)-like protein/PAS domain S-box-containing protein
MNYERMTKKELLQEIARLNSRLLALSDSNSCPNDLLWQKLFENTSEGVMISDKNQIILDVNPGFCKITGFSREEVIGKKTRFFKSVHHDDEFFNKITEALEIDGKWQGELWNRRKNGEIYPEWLSIIRIDQNKTPVYLGIFTDITKYINRNIKVHNHAYYDTLTGLPNRLLMHDRLSFMLNHAKRNKQIMAVLLLDLNRFKLINDTLGYTVGDLLLQTFGSRLKTCVRDVDAVFRLGDDEFAIILEEVAQIQDAAKVAKRVLSICSAPFLVSDHELYVTVSIGISIFPSDGDNHESLLKNAEVAMNRSKELGINNYQHYKPTMNAKAFEQLTLEHDLRKALRRKELVIFYQPILELSTRRIVGAEALIRWKHPELGLIAPGQFIPIAEETGLILPIGEFVLRRACGQAKLWQEKYGQFVISVNLSTRQFQQQDLALTVSTVLHQIGFTADSLELEITESLGMKNPELTLKTLHELKAMGVHIAIDDFGTGYSSLSYLNKFPIDTLKIDRSFLGDLRNDQNDSAIVLAVIALAHSLKLKVIAEGVENEGQADYLAIHDCEKVQGYLFSPPVNADDFEKLLSKERTAVPVKEIAQIL